MSAVDYEAHFRSQVERYLGRPWQAEDGLPSTAIAAAERRLECPLPGALRAFYCSAGALDALCVVHNRIRPPEELAFDEGYLLFMDENQERIGRLSGSRRGGTPT
jgi:hypothetical protein